MHWLLAGSAALAAMAVSPQLAETEKHPLGGAPEVLGLDAERHSRMTVAVSIGEHGPFPFMIDTGAQATVLSRDLADRLGLTQRRTMTLVGMASRRPVEVVALQGLALGSRSFDIATAPLVDQVNIGSAQGILGLDSLQDQRVLLDFEANTLTVADAGAAASNRGFEIVVKARRKLGQLVITSAMVDGVKVAVIVDTGAQGSIGNMELEKRLRGRDMGMTSMTDINGQDIQGQMRLARYVRVGEVQLGNVPISFADSPTFASLGLNGEPAMVLGINELKMFRRVAIDFKDRKVLFDLPRNAGRIEDAAGSRLRF